MFCTQCGNKLLDDAKFCPQCGAKVVTAPEPVAEPAVEAAPVVEPVVEAPPVVEPVVEAAPVVEPVVEAAPVVEPVVEATPVVEPTPVETTAAAGANTATTNASAGATTEAPKKKKKVWLIVLIAVLGSFLLIGLIIIIAVVILFNVAKNKISNQINNGINNSINSFTSEIESEFGITGENTSQTTTVGGSGELDYYVNINNIKNASYEGTCEIVSVSGADSMIAYLEKVSGKSLSDEEKEEIRNPELGINNKFQLAIFSEDENYGEQQYYDGEFSLTVPLPIGVDGDYSYRNYSGWDMLTYAEIDEGNYADIITIKPENNKFTLKRQIPDEGKIYASGIFPDYADDMDDGDFGMELTGTVKPGKNDDTFAIDGTYTLMYWYGSMEEPYVIKYNYSVDHSMKLSDVYNNGYDGGDYDDFDYDDSDYGDIDYEDFDFEDFLNN